MRMNVLLKKLHMEKREFVTSAELKAYSKQMKINYDTMIRYFASRGYLVRIFRGIFYVKSPEELELRRSRYNHLELVAKGMELKKVRSWYFGLHSALKLNNMTHEHFVIEDVVNEKLLRTKPIVIAGYKFKFTKLSPSLLGFGVRKMSNGVMYSDPEKTLLDFIYIWRYNGLPENKIISDISGWARSISKEKFLRYVKNYPKSVERIAKRVVK